MRAMCTSCVSMQYMEPHFKYMARKEYLVSAYVEKKSDGSCCDTGSAGPDR